MSSRDVSSDFHVSDSGSRLLSESFLGSSNSLSRTGHGGDDLSLSELSLHDRPQPARRKFSLFARPLSPQHEDDSAVADDEGGGEDLGEVEPDQTMRPEDIEKAQRVAAKTREEKLQSDLYILKKLNSAFDVYKEALRETKTSTERVADQLVHTNALLDKYVAILSKSEKVTRLILDERWEGAAADEDQIENELREEIERRRREEETRALAAERERERKIQEELERQAKEQKERLEREKQEKSKAPGRGSGVRGVRGTRASMRGMRASSAARGASSSTARSTPPGTSITGSGGQPTRRTGSSAAVRGTSASSRPSSVLRK